jgi:hypothetical protein
VSLLKVDRYDLPTVTLKAFTDGTATAVTKRNNAIVVPIIAPMITLFFFISVRDGIHYNTS